MNNPRWKIRKARPTDPWAGTWQVWECTNCPRLGVHREERLMCAWKTQADCVAWLGEYLKQADLLRKLADVFNEADWFKEGQS